MIFSVFDLIALLLVLTATFAWINHRFIRLPNTIGMLVMGLAASLLLIAFELSVPEISIYEDLTAVVGEIDFQNTVLNGMLAFLLFAGALHVDLSLLRSRASVVGAMATFGVLISTVVVGLGFWLIARLVGVDIPLIWAMVFGALISPTDPVAVLSTLKAVRVPKSLEVDMIGESLFNDGVGVVIFAVVLALAVGIQGGQVDLLHVGELFVVEALGGALLGLIAGYIAYRAMLAIDDYPIEVLISLALVTGAYALAAKLHLSGPIAVVVGGLLIGNRGASHAMSDETQRYLFGFWTLIDEILNSVLFLLIGLEVLVLRYDPSFVWLALASIPLVLLGRLLAVSVPVLALAFRQDFVPGTIPVLVWGGLRGGISVALALSIPEVAEKSTLLAATYTVVVFSIVVQGLSLKRLVQRVVDLKILADQSAYEVVRELYEQNTPRAHTFRYTLLAFDLITILFVIATSFTPRGIFVEVADTIIGIIILIDFVARLVLARKRLRSMLHIGTLADIVAIISFLAPVAGEGLGFLRILRTMRLLYTYQVLARLKSDFTIIRRHGDVLVAVVNLGVFIFVMTGLVYETQYRSNPDIGNYADALYFTVTALTTTGFGDITLPGTTGRLISVAIMIVGVTLFLRLAQVLLRPEKVTYECPTCGLTRHDPDAVHCKHCGETLHIKTEGAT